MNSSHKNVRHVTLWVALALVMPTCLAACNGASHVRPDSNKGGSSPVLPDQTKTQLHVKYTNGGLRREWIDHVVASFEEKYKDYSFEEGKKGVQIVDSFNKRDIVAANIPQDTNQVYLMESSDYLNFKAQNVLADITDVVTSPIQDGPSTTEEKTIADLLTPEGEAFYNLGTKENPSYYGLPFFSSACSISYNQSVFEKNNFYFAEGKSGDDVTDLDDAREVSSLFVSKSSDAKSAGPDGIKGTSDDGLPATYADFHALLTFMKEGGSQVTPFIWNGYETGYLISTMLSAYCTAIGVDQSKLMMSWQGEGKDLYELSADGGFVNDSTGGHHLLSSLDITPNNAYQLHQHKGLLDALKLAKLIVGDTKNYYSKSFSSSFDHLTAQKYFICGKEKGLIKNDIAMNIEGTWWNAEANDNYKDENDRQSKKFALLPMPFPTKEQIGGKNILVSERDSMIFINKNCDPAVLPAAKAFVSFLHNQESLNTFTRYTDMVRNLKKYDLTEETLSHMSTYGKSVYETFFSDHSYVFDFRPANNVTAKNATLLGYRHWPFGVGSVDADNNPMFYFAKNTSVTPEQHFLRINQYFKSSWNSVQKS